MPKICVPAIGYAIDQHQPMSAVMSLQLCLTHVRAFRAKETLEIRGERTMRGIFEVMAKHHNRVAPDFARAFVVAVPIESAEGSMWGGMFSGERPQ